MTKQRAQKITGERNSYIRRIQRDILKKFPKMTFDVYRGPGLKKAYIRFSPSTTDHFDVLETIGDEWMDAVEKGYTFYILPA